MKLKLLTTAILGLNLVACAHQPVVQNSNLSHKVYQGYEQLVSKESYAYNGKMTFEFEGDLKPDTSKATTAPATITNYDEKNQQRLKVLQSSLRSFPQLATEQQQWLSEDLKHLSVQTPPHSPKFDKVLKTFFNRYYYSFDGVVDLGRGQISFNPKIGYESRNAQAWISVPLAVDLKQNSVYADISALSPFVTDPQYDGRYIVFNYKDLLDQHKINQRPVLDFMRNLMLINATLAKDSDYQKVSLSAEDQKQGGVERIRYTGTYTELMAQYGLYFYLNQNYLKTVLPDQVDQETLTSLNPMQMALNGGLSSHRLEQITQGLNGESQDTAVRANQRIARVIETLYAEKTDSIEETGAVARNAAVDAAAMDAVDATMSTEAEAYATASAVDSEYDSEDDEYEKILQKMEVAAAEREEILQQFKGYQKLDKIVSAAEMKQIVEKEAVAYQKFIKLIEKEFDGSEIFLKNGYVSDLTLDQKGRIVRNEFKMDVTGLEEIGIERFSAKMVGNIEQYGQAKINQQDLKNAVNFSQAANENTVFNLGKLVDEWTEKNTNQTQDKTTENWSIEQRYQQFAKELLNKNINFIDAYTAVYRYAYILKGEDVTNEDFSIEQLNNTGRWNAIYYAREHDLGATKAQLKEYDDSPDDWVHYDEPLSEDIWQVFDRLMGEVRYEKLYQQLNPKYKDNASLFAVMYLEIEKQEEEKQYNGRVVEFPDSFIEFTKVLGEVAAEDLKTQKINQEKLSQLTITQLNWLDNEIYTSIYRQLLKRQ